MVEMAHRACEDLAAESSASDLRALQELELQILLDVQRVCDDLGIQFFLGEGTLLGAIRHQGFIPWDDDIDLLMRRSEFERFLALAPARLAPKYEVQHSTTVANYWSPLIKVRLVDADARFRQANIAHLADNNGPLIDVFPLEYVPRASGPGLRLQSTWIRWLRSTLAQKLHVKPAVTLRQKFMRITGSLLSTRWLHRQLDQTLTMHGDERHAFLATLSSYRPLVHQVVPASAYESHVDVHFEGHVMPAPRDFHMVLTTTYGDYMTPPPIEHRHAQHEFQLD